MSGPCKSPRPLLRPEFFQEGLLHLSAQGLVFETKVEREDRVDAFDGTGRNAEQTRAHIAALPARAPTRCVLHPVKPTAEVLLQQLQAAQMEAFGPDLTPGARSGASAEALDIRQGLKGSYDRQWHCRRHADHVFESQRLVLVAFAGREAVGCTAFEVSVDRDPASRKLWLSVELALIYVAPPWRQQGYGLDLAVATGWLVRDLCVAACRACPKHWTIAPQVQVEPASDAGRVFAGQVRWELELLRDRLDLYELPVAQHPFEFDKVELQAGG